MMARIIVTGGTGYIGSHTVVELMQQGYDVTIVDNLSNSSIDVLDGIEAITGKKPDFANIDCANFVDLDSVFRQYPDVVGAIHFAASKAVGESVEKPLLYYRNNIGSLITLLEVMRLHQVPNLVFSSSCTVYGQPDAAHLPVDETAPIQKALSPYGNTKQINEEIIYDEARADKGLHATILRYFNPIGAHPSANIGELPNGVPQNLLPFITQTAAGLRPELKVFGNDYNTPDGSCIRDYIYVVDLAKAHVKAIERMLKAKNREQVEVFNLGTGTGLSVLTLIKEFEAATGVKIPYSIVGRREGDIEQVWAAPEKANKVLGWKADTPIREVLSSAWKWEKRIRNIKS
ncbi:MAG: UDP-glucose 4-epimerase GalE [Paludibacteraceae bacterium]|nr:UDP-glucose 4-epimerase GalE [Paludibacteraceae bacterium]MBR6492673.1 UDP-glucose 4-epimerase GalE [Paludibacteraceae bacterium]